MGAGRLWTQEELTQLEEEWGNFAIGTIAKRHNRSLNAIKIKAIRQKLGAHIDSDDRISVNQLFLAFGNNSYGYLLGRMIKAGLKIHYHKVEKCRFKMINLSEFWKFAEKNQTMFDFSKLEKNALGEEPAWVAAARREDFIRSTRIKPHNTAWTAAEDAELLRLVKMHRYTYDEISQRFNRSCGAIARRLIHLGVKERPVRCDNHTPWTDEEKSIMCEMIKHGSNYENISAVIGKSSKAIQGRVYDVYLTERLDKVREMLNGGNWGDNRPERRVKHLKISAMSREEKNNVKADLTAIVSILSKRAESLERLESKYGWQRKQCRNWNNGCLAGESNCDECLQFRRKDCYEE